MSLVSLIRSALREVKLDEVVTVQPQTCESFYKLMEIYKQDLTVTESFEDCMAVCLATHVAVVFEGDPLWLYLVAPPSSGKSTICELLGADEIRTCPMDTLTGIVSGDRRGKHLLPMMQGKCVIVKDGTLLLESSPQQLASVYGELRSAYDGSFVKHFRNGVSAEFSNVSFGMIVGITERIYSLNMSALGERFLHCKLDTSRDIEKERNKNAIRKIFETTGRTTFEGNEVTDMRSFPKQRAYTAGFMNYLHMRARTGDVLRPRYTKYDEDLVQSLADTIACSRAQAPRVREYGLPSELLYDARPEASTRVVKQLSRLALCLCYVLGESSITSRIRSLLTKVALDTAFSRQHTIIRTLALSNGLTRSALSALTNIPLETITRRIDDLISLGIFLPDNQKNRPARGRSVPTLRCAQWIEDAFRRVENHVSVPNREDSQSEQETASGPAGGNPEAKRPNRRPIPRPRTR